MRAGNDEHGARPLPCQALDHATGFVTAAAVLSVIARGDSARIVRTCLASTARFVMRAEFELPVPSVGDAVARLRDVQPMPEDLVDFECAVGRVSAIRHAATVSSVPVDENELLPAPQRNQHAPEWW
eukprot:TRINITY_DN1209_c0_g2_i1.p3 TRINITY_DN1209_c0_g2~~TRINITY_DN1209_c0_g2_i1.p3  ORF type:complete len:127 (+),score=32.36 TRINITY_DN1209_c0_g2_i1:570-950(+)